ncbi:tetratricopeptide repeat protein [Lichenihabitans psoromatis]|uniref:tetratricopeptide repeat protein n=1 Tax=Lichenihabitans psoromatis TaxID=2528642 RepID=UPI0010382EFE|nr:tetratricopeptide repeat protein [Lichenihabitans psoromatis]
MSQAPMALKKLLALISGSRSNVDEHLWHADTARDRADWPAASRHYSKVLEQVPRRSDIWVQLGHAEKERGDLDAAKLAYERGRDLAPGNPDPLLQLGHVLRASGDWDGAATNYRAALRLKPSRNQPEVSLELADLARDLREWTTAARLYASVLQSTPERADIWMQLGHSAKESADYDVARTAYEKAIAIDPGDADKHLQRGHLSKLMGNHEAALLAYRKVLELSPGDDRAFREIRSLGSDVHPSALAFGSSAAASLTPAAHPGSLVVCTIASNNYIAQVKTLLEGVRHFYPEARCCVCIVDRDAVLELKSIEGCDVILAAQLGIPDFDSMAFRYDQVELCTAIKPFLLLMLLTELNYDSALYFDPDIQIFGRSEDVLQRLWRDACFLLTPHLHQPALGHVAPTDLTILQAGTYNLGFLGVSSRPEALVWLRWWAHHLVHHCLNRVDEGLFVDQKFFDLVPGFTAGAQILRDPGLNLAYWNLAEHRLTGEGNAWSVDDSDLQFFHFSGFDVDAPRRLSRHTSMFSAVGDSALAKLMDGYRDALIRHGIKTMRSQPYSYGAFASGVSIPRVVRRLFADTVASWASDPFADIEDWMMQPVLVGRQDGRALSAPRLVHYVWSTDPTLRSVFDLDNQGDLLALKTWFVRQAERRFGLEPCVIERAERNFRSIGSLAEADRDGIDRPTLSLVQNQRRPNDPPASVAAVR